MNTPLHMINDVWLMGLVVWREARGEPWEGKVAVAYSILNRVERAAWWGHDVPTVVFKKWQYSSITDPQDPQLKMLPTPYAGAEAWETWLECLEAAYRAYLREVSNPVPGADSYFADTIPPPKWADSKKMVKKIGHHIFYDLDSDYERTYP